MINSAIRAITQVLGSYSQTKQQQQLAFFTVYNPAVDIIIGIGVVLLGVGLYMIYADYG